MSANDPKRTMASGRVEARMLGVNLSTLALPASVKRQKFQIETLPSHGRRSCVSHIGVVSATVASKTGTARMIHAVASASGGMVTRITSSSAAGARLRHSGSFG
jgi:hypothetical protein